MAAARSSDTQSTVRNEWNVADKAGLVPLGTHNIYANTSGPPREPGQPVVIIFPGSGGACDYWLPVSSLVHSFARILLYDRSGLGHSERGPLRDTGPNAARELASLLDATGIRPPYILVAHSYGGCVAREFLQVHTRDVVGMVLCETGTETRAQHAEEQYQTQILGDCPLSVIRGEAAFASTAVNQVPTDEICNAQNKSSCSDDQPRREMLEVMAKMDEQLKKEQMKLSRNSKFRNVPDCGHNVHRIRPDVVVEEIKWVLDNVRPGANTGQASIFGLRILETKLLGWIRRMLKQD